VRRTFPQGWPEAVEWLLDLRGHSALRRHPVILPVIPPVTGTLEGARGRLPRRTVRARRGGAAARGGFGARGLPRRGPPPCRGGEGDRGGGACTARRAALIAPPLGAVKSAGRISMTCQQGAPRLAFPGRRRPALPRDMNEHARANPRLNLRHYLSSRSRRLGIGTPCRRPGPRRTWLIRSGSRRSATGGSRTTSGTAPTWRDLLRLGRLPKAWIAPPPVRELRELTRYRVKLVRLRSSAKDQVHAVLAKLGICVPCSDLFGAYGSAWLDGLRLPEPYAGKVGSLRQLIGWLNGEISLFDEVIGDFLGSYPPYQAVLRLPGLGPVLAAVAVAEIGDVSRFPGPGQLRLGGADAAAPRVRRQGRPRAHITKQGSPILRWAMVEAVGASRPAARPASSGTASPTAAARRRGTSPRPPRPASCSPASSTRCATGRPGP
jgi:Transposase IS116/IS110/IS902 family